MECGKAIAPSGIELRCVPMFDYNDETKSYTKLRVDGGGAVSIIATVGKSTFIIKQRSNKNLQQSI